jgi:hypothetical protein
MELHGRHRRKRIGHTAMFVGCTETWFYWDLTVGNRGEIMYANHGSEREQSNKVSIKREISF